MGLGSLVAQYLPRPQSGLGILGCSMHPKMLATLQQLEKMLPDLLWEYLEFCFKLCFYDINFICLKFIILIFFNFLDIMISKILKK